MRKEAKKKGFTLIEILISLVILSVVILATLQGSIIIIRHNAYLKQRRIAIELVQSKMNEILSQPVDVWSDGFTLEDASSFSYSISWRVTSTTSPSGKSVWVIVMWKSLGNDHSLTLTSWKGL